MLDLLIKEPFLGFQPEALKFLKALSVSRNNNKEWFDKNRRTYETSLKQPMRNLMDTLAIELSKIDSDIVVNYKSIFRINRDIRFSKNKSPYKNYYAAAFAFGKVKSSEIPQFYFHFSASEFIFAAGQYSADINYLKKIRDGIFRNFDEYKSIVCSRNFVKEYGKVSGEKLSKLPRGYEHLKDSKTDPLLAGSIMMKQFYVHKTYSPDKVLNEKMVDIIAENVSRTHDFTKFLDKITR